MTLGLAFMAQPTFTGQAAVRGKTALTLFVQDQAQLFIFTSLILFVLLCVAEKSGKEVMSKGSSGMEVILASLEVNSLINTAGDYQRPTIVCAKLN